MLNKKGSVMIEATIVIPILILICGSMILYSIYEYENLMIQKSLHQEIDSMADNKNDKGITFDVMKLSKGNSVNLGGLSNQILNKRLTNRKYSFDFQKIVRTKQVVFQNLE